MSYGSDFYEDIFDENEFGDPDEFDSYVDCYSCGKSCYLIDNQLYDLYPNTLELDDLHICKHKQMSILTDFDEFEEE